VEEEHMNGIGYREKCQHFQTVITYDKRELLVKAIILPARKAPHVSADSPRFMEPGHVARIISYSLHDDYGEEVTGLYFDHERMSIEALILHEWAIDQTASRMLSRRILEDGPTLREVNARRGYPEGELA
jgi:hypothetical protein